jgi:hypothetical protein
VIRTRTDIHNEETALVEEGFAAVNQLVSLGRYAEAAVTLAVVSDVLRKVSAESVVTAA